VENDSKENISEDITKEKEVFVARKVMKNIQRLYKF